MDWGQIFSSANLHALGIPIGVGLAVTAITLLLRSILYHRIRKMAEKTKTRFDDIMVAETRIASMVWCVWLGIFVGWKIADTPVNWIATEDKIIPSLFAAFGIYTAVVIIVAVFKWYKAEICPRTTTGLDDIIMSVLIVVTPILGIALGAILILKFWGYESDAVNGAIADHGVKVAAISILTVVIIMILELIVPRVIDTAIRNAKEEQTEEDTKKRSDTLVSVIGTTLQIMILFIFLLMVLSEMGLNITAIITGASVFGVAIGFGAQWLVKDLIAGLFVILENQYRKGDVVKIAGESGVVEEINLRRTVLRDMDGVYHVVPNGQITVASNYTKQLSKINLNIGVSYDTNLEHAISVINQVGNEIAADPKWATSIMSPPRALRVDNLGESSVEIKIVGDVKPSRQWDVTGELRLRLKNAFDKEGIEIPWPHTKVYFGNLPPIIFPDKGERKVEEKTEIKEIKAEKLNN